MPRFAELKSKLIAAPLLGHPDFSQAFISTADTSKFAAGAVLSQVLEGQEHLVGYASILFNAAEQKYWSTRECVWPWYGQ